MGERVNKRVRQWMSDGGFGPLSLRQVSRLSPSPLASCLRCGLSGTGVVSPCLSGEAARGSVEWRVGAVGTRAEPVLCGFAVPTRWLKGSRAERLRPPLGTHGGAHLFGSQTWGAAGTWGHGLCPGQGEGQSGAGGPLGWPWLDVGPWAPGGWAWEAAWPLPAPWRQLGSEQ